jgi:hypothetical protein
MKLRVLRRARTFLLLTEAVSLCVLGFVWVQWWRSPKLGQCDISTMGQIRARFPGLASILSDDPQLTVSRCTTPENVSPPLAALPVPGRDTTYALLIGGPIGQVFTGVYLQDCLRSTIAAKLDTQTATLTRMLGPDILRKDSVPYKPTAATCPILDGSARIREVIARTLAPGNESTAIFIQDSE